MRDPNIACKVAAAAGLLLGTTACDLVGSSKKQETKVTTTKAASAQSKLCASNATYARLKESAFDEAKRIREKDTEALDALADASVVRMENPLLESRDEALGLTVCSGRMILELPPGAGAAFDGRQRLAADVTYSAQGAADGSGTVFKIDGGEPIVYRLASFDPRRSSTRTASIGDETDAPLAEDVAVDDPAPVPSYTPPPPPPPPPPSRSADVTTVAEARARAERVADNLQAEQTARAERMRAADRRARAEQAAEQAREERTAAAERAARAERVAAARRTDRGESDSAARPSRTARPSFNCRYARSRVEKMVCGSNELASRDREMAALYFRTNDRADPVVRRRLSASRLRFLAYRDRCPNEACVAAAYDDRVDEINDLADE